MKSAEIEEVLAGCELFKGLDQSEIKNIAKICRVNTYDKGALVYQQGDFGETIYIIAKGQVILERTVDMGPVKAGWSSPPSAREGYLDAGPPCWMSRIL